MSGVSGCGSGLRDAVCSLAPGVRLEGLALVDLDGGVYALNRSAADLCALLTSPVLISELRRQLLVVRGVPVADAQPALQGFLDDLERRGLLHVSASFARERLRGLADLPYRIGGLIVSRSWPRPELPGTVRRYPPTAAGVLRASLEGHQPVAWMGVVAALGAGAVAVTASPTDDIRMLALRAIGLVVAGFFALLMLNVAVHEEAHLLAARRTGSPVYGAYAAAGRAGVSSLPSRPRDQALVAAAGPCAALVLDILCGLAIVLGPGDAWALAAVDQFRLSALAAVGVLAAAQIVALTPIGNDGRQILAALSRRAEVTRVP